MKLTKRGNQPNGLEMLAKFIQLCTTALRDERQTVTVYWSDARIYKAPYNDDEIERMEFELAPGKTVGMLLRVDAAKVVIAGDLTGGHLRDISVIPKCLVEQVIGEGGETVDLEAYVGRMRRERRA